MDPTRTVAAKSTPLSQTDSSTGEGRFLPGQIIAERYRIVSLLGEGGMGEVYRATDTKLSQPVALKFLSLASTPAALQRFRAEVRLARQISHPNVCRVYDIAELDGQVFLSMEYVDGEDLSSLLRRIGRLPQDKAIDIARQICAGVAASHDRGVLHRDLKPSNILIDGRGVARVADFGLAGVEEVRAGTPAYMAPEQLGGREVTVKSDIYALGLVLYELFTGKRAIQSPGKEPSSPSTLIPDMDPAVEAIILQCLEADPARRPASALVISAALPGGDPLAAALAAGETPSPALVAAAGEHTGIAPWQAAAMCAAILVGLCLIWWARGSAGLWSNAGIEQPPSVLEYRGRELMSAMGHPNRPVDWASGYYYNNLYRQYKREHPDTRFPALSFWYRESPIPLVNVNPIDAGVTVGAVTGSSPPPTSVGTAILSLDTAGRLMTAIIRPEERKHPPQPFRWDEFLLLAGFDMSRLKPVAPEWIPEVPFDEQVAWTGSLPDLASVPLRLEAAALAGKVVFFRVIPPWIRPTSAFERNLPSFGHVVTTILVSLLVLGGAVLARRNLSLGRGDRRGALRVAMLVLILHMTAFAFGADHVLGATEVDLIGIALAMGLLKAALLWLGYVALEPIVRRRMPHWLISWTRLTSGRWRDPVVGRDVLTGVMAGVAAHLCWSADSLLQLRLGGDHIITANAADVMGSLSATLALLPNEAAEALLQAFPLFLIFFFFRLIGRIDWVAVVLSASLLTLQSNAFYTPAPLISVPLSIAAYGIVYGIIVRVGLTGAVSAMIASDLLFVAPATMDFHIWFAPWAALIYGALALFTIMAFRVALAGRPLFPAAGA